MKTIYLPLRSLGDFIITASVVKDHFEAKIPVILPVYLNDIYNAISGNLYFDVEGYLNFNNQPAFVELYKVKDLNNFRRLLEDIGTVFLGVDRQNRYLLDYSSKRLLFTGAKMQWPALKQNLYYAKYLLYQRNGLLAESPFRNRLANTTENIAIRKILIIPESRIALKNIDPAVIRQLCLNLEAFTIETAFFNRDGIPQAELKTYSNFKELINLITEFDLVISAESLPYHLAYFLNIRHYVIYNESRHFNTTFMTPYMEARQSYTVFTGQNHQVVANTVLKWLKNNG